MTDGPRQEAVDNGTCGCEYQGISGWLFRLSVEPGDDKGNRGNDNSFQASWSSLLDDFTRSCRGGNTHEESQGHKITPVAGSGQEESHD